MASGFRSINSGTEMKHADDKIRQTVLETAKDKRSTTEQAKFEKKAMDRVFKAGTDIITELFDLSLICPISKAKMQTPVRSTKCEHTQCIDLNSFIEFVSHLDNRTRDPSMKCTVCQTSVFASDLVVDTWIESLLQTTEDPEDRSELGMIRLRSDGSWVAAEKRNRSDDIVVENQTPPLSVGAATPTVVTVKMEPMTQDHSPPPPPNADVEPNGINNSATHSSLEKKRGRPMVKVPCRKTLNSRLWRARNEEHGPKGCSKKPKCEEKKKTLNNPTKTKPVAATSSRPPAKRHPKEPRAKKVKEVEGKQPRLLSQCTSCKKWRMIELPAKHRWWCCKDALKTQGEMAWTGCVPHFVIGTRKLEETLAGRTRFPEWTDGGKKFTALLNVLDKYIQKEKDLFAFLRPVSPELDGALDYYEKVEEPMDLRMLKKRLQNGTYYYQGDEIFDGLPEKLRGLCISKEEMGCDDDLSKIRASPKGVPLLPMRPNPDSGCPIFFGLRRDFFQIRSNCVLYNGEKHPLSLKAQAMCTWAEQKLLPLALNLQPTPRSLEEVGNRKMAAAGVASSLTAAAPKSGGKNKEAETSRSKRNRGDSDNDNEEDVGSPTVIAAGGGSVPRTRAITRLVQVEVKLNILCNPSHSGWRLHENSQRYSAVVCPELASMRKAADESSSSSASTSSKTDTSPISALQLGKLLILLERGLDLTEDLEAQDADQGTGFQSTIHMTNNEKPWSDNLLLQVDEWCDATIHEVLPLDRSLWENRSK